MSLSPENQSLVGRTCSDDQSSGWRKGYGMCIYGADLNRLLDADREEGLERGRFAAAELAAGEDV